MKLAVACLVSIVAVRPASADPAETESHSFAISGGVFSAFPVGAELRFDDSHRLLEDLWLHLAYAHGSAFVDSEHRRDRGLAGIEQRGCDSSGVVCGFAGVGVGLLHIERLHQDYPPTDVWGGAISVQAGVEVGMPRGIHLRLALEPHLVVGNDSGLGCDLTLGLGLRM